MSQLIIDLGQHQNKSQPQEKVKKIISLKDSVREQESESPDQKEPVAFEGQQREEYCKPEFLMFRERGRLKETPKEDLNENDLIKAFTIP